MMREGLLIRGIGGFYSVLFDDGEIVECRARGRFRSEGLTPTVGDRVAVRELSEGGAALERILPRNNELLRPSVSNLDRLLIVVSACEPAPDLMLLDRLIVHAVLSGIEPVPVLNKIDAAGPGVVEAFFADYGSTFPCVCVSAHTGEGLDALRDAVCGKTCCFAGQSAVGKSSLLNALIPTLSLPVGELSSRTARGKHTTRKAELWPFAGGALLDTPGFSLLESLDAEQAALDACYPEFRFADGACRFPGCAHVSEPDCAIKPLLAAGKLTPGRYARYCALTNECMLRRKHRYD